MPIVARTSFLQRWLITTETSRSDSQFAVNIENAASGMPGMDGYEVARLMRKMPGLENTVLAALTGWGQAEDRRRTAEAGFHHHLVKPPEPKDLEALLTGLERTAPRTAAGSRGVRPS